MLEKTQWMQLQHQTKKETKLVVLQFSKLFI